MGTRRLGARYAHVAQRARLVASDVALQQVMVSLRALVNGATRATEGGSAMSCWAVQSNAAHARFAHARACATALWDPARAMDATDLLDRLQGAHAKTLRSAGPARHEAITSLAVLLREITNA